MKTGHGAMLRYAPSILLSLLAQVDAGIAAMPALVNHTIVYRLDDCTALFINMAAIGVKALTQVRAKFDKARGKLLGRDIPGGQRANTCRIGQPAAFGERVERRTCGGMPTLARCVADHPDAQSHTWLNNVDQ